MSLYVTGSNQKGEAYLVLTQGDIEETINLAGAFDASIDMSRFAPGPISISFIYEDAGEVAMNVQLAVIKNESSGKSEAATEMEDTHCPSCNKLREQQRMYICL